MTTYPDYLIITQDTSAYSGKETPLKMVLERNTHDIYEIDHATTSPEESDSVKDYSVLLGMVDINHKMHLVLVETVTPICEIEGQNIFEMGTPSFLELASEPQFEQLEQQYHQSEQGKDTVY